MLFRETVAVYYENHTKHKMHSLGRLQSFALKQVVYIVTLGSKGLRVMAVAGLGVDKSTECISYLAFWGILN
jgi:hypothetical protein